MVKALLQHRARVDLRSKASVMHAFMVIDLHDDGIGFFYVIQDKRTALIMATEGRHATVVDLLLKHYAQVDLRDRVST